MDTLINYQGPQPVGQLWTALKTFHCEKEVSKMQMLELYYIRWWNDGASSKNVRFHVRGHHQKGSWPSLAKSDAAADDCYVYRQSMKNLHMIAFCCFTSETKAIRKKTTPRCSAELIVKADCWATSLHESLIITLFTLSVDLICSLLADFSALLRLYSVWLTDFHRCEVFFSSQHPSWLSTAAVAGRSQHGATPAIDSFIFLIEASTSELTPCLGSYAKLALCVSTSQVEF